MAARKKASEARIPARETAEVLDLLLAGQEVEPGELRAAALSAAGLRRTWLAAVAQALTELRPDTVEYEGFRNCVQWIGTYLVQHGVLSNAEMQDVWLRVEAVGGR